MNSELSDLEVHVPPVGIKGEAGRLESCRGRGDRDGGIDSKGDK